MMPCKGPSTLEITKIPIATQNVLDFKSDLDCVSVGINFFSTCSKKRLGVRL